jgi:hypothetical protein
VKSIYTTSAPAILITSTDTGGSQLVIDGKIKLKNDAIIEGFTESGLKFTDGSELQSDVVVFATGYRIPNSSYE